MDEHIQFLVLGLGSGAAYALLGLGLVLEFRSSGVINFAHGAIAMFVAFTFVQLQSTGEIILPVVLIPHELPLGFGPLGPAAALLVSLVYAAILGALIYLLVFKRLHDKPALARLVASVGLLLFLQTTVVINLGADAFGVSVPTAGSVLPTGTVDFLGVTVPQDRLWLAGVTVVAAFALWAVYRFTRFGLATRAAAETEEGVAVLGYRANVLGASNWVIASVLAGLAGILITPISGLDPTIFTLLVVPALGAALVGKLSSFSITLIAGFAIGMLQSELTKLQIDLPDFPHQGLKEGLPFIVIIVALLIFGKSLPLRGSLREPRPPSAGRPRRMVPYSAALGAAIIIGLFVLPSLYRQGILQSITSVILILSLVVVTGYCGQISLVQMAFAGVGGFFASILATEVGISFLPATLLAGLIAIIFGLVVGLPSLRSRGLHLAVLTLAAAVALDSFFFRNANIAGGVEGRLLPSPTLFGWDLGPAAGEASEYPRPVWGIVLLIFALMFAWLVANLRRSATGRHMLAVRAREGAASAAGIHVGSTKLFGWALAAFIAGVTGSLIGYQNSAVSGEQFGVLLSLALVALAYNGGIARISGAVLAGGLFAPGGILLVGLDQWLGIGGYGLLIAGFALIIVVQNNPDGLAEEFGFSFKAAALSFKRSWLRMTSQEYIPGGSGLPVDSTRHHEPATNALFALGGLLIGLTLLVTELNVGNAVIALVIGGMYLAVWFSRSFQQLRQASGRGVGAAGGAALTMLIFPNFFLLPYEIGRYNRLKGRVPAISVTAGFIPTVPFLALASWGFGEGEINTALSFFIMLLVPVGVLTLMTKCQRRMNEAWLADLGSAAPAVHVSSLPAHADATPSATAHRARSEFRKTNAAALAAPPLLEVHGLSVVFGGLHAVNDVSLAVRPGTLVGLIGPNGAGKTTTLDAIMGYTPIRGGRVVLAGQPMTGVNPTRCNRLGIGRTFQQLDLFDDLTIEENVLVAAERRNLLGRFLDLFVPVRPDRGRAMATEVLERLELAGLRERLPHQLSTAQRKRVAIARALASDPSLVLLDEPAAGLDVAEAEELGNLLRTVVEDGTAVLVIDHDVGLMFDICDYIYVLDFGQLIAEGMPDEIRANKRVVNAYLGEGFGAGDASGARKGGSAETGAEFETISGEHD